MTCFHCGDKVELFPWLWRGDEILICESCHPKCEEPGCRKLMLLGGEGGCEQHEHLFWEGFQELVQQVEVA